LDKINHTTKEDPMAKKNVGKDRSCRVKDKLRPKSSGCVAEAKIRKLKKRRRLSQREKDLSLSEAYVVSCFRGKYGESRSKAKKWLEFVRKHNPVNPDGANKLWKPNGTMLFYSGE